MCKWYQSYIKVLTIEEILVFFMIQQLSVSPEIIHKFDLTMIPKGIDTDNWNKPKRLYKAFLWSYMKRKKKKKKGDFLT